MKRSAGFLALVVMVAAPSGVWAETSKELANKSRLAWSALSCSALAGTAKNTTEFERLFQLGYREAKTFMTAALAKKIDPADINTTMPMVMGFAMSGPNVDFMIGRLWEKAMEDSHKLVFKDEAGAYRDTALWKDFAATEFQTRNCLLIH